jgi:hypothetical protein
VRMMLHNAGLARALLAAALLIVAALAGVIMRGEESTAQTRSSIGVDADTTGNTATSLGPIDSCLSVSTGNTFQVDVFVADVTDLLAWEAYLVYDMSVINVVSRDGMMFQAANAGSQVFDVSEGLPDIDGRYRLAAVDLADPPAPDSGSGVLARLTLKAVSPGVSPLSLSPIDINEDGNMDLGPFLTNIESESISDLNGDGFFDGPIANAEIAVGGTCPSGTPLAPPTSIPTAVPTAPSSPEATATPTGTPTATAAASPTVPASPTVSTPVASPTPGGPAEGEGSSSDDGPPWMIAYVGGAVAAVLLGGAVLLAIGRRRAR